MPGARRLTAVVALFVLAACAASDPPSRDGEPVGSSGEAIVRGTDSNASQDAVVLVIHYDALSKDGSAGCSGTMLTPRLVLTARHCVATTDEQVACASDGTPISGGAVQGDFDPSKIYVFGGNHRPDFIAGLASVTRGVQIIDDGAKTLCNHDIALMLTDKDVPGAKIAPIRLDGGPKPNETFTAVGWGITDTTNTPAIRQQKTDVPILEIGPADGLAPAEFLAGEGACAGDSGGPALSAAGAVIGSLSRGGNGTGSPGAAGCDGGTNIYTSAASFKDLIQSAYATAGQDPWLEGQPNPTLAKLGASCASDAECQSNMCKLQPSVCTQDCSQSGCPDGFACNDQKLCIVSPGSGGSSGGCAVDAHGHRGLFAAAAGLAMIVALTRRRRGS